ncbi:MAG: universal stress protein [Chitinophagaceae bacterium]|jgi:nucleotide-binding universal stress UspA family protein|nr:universal stress protein [Chitinophagaceae bacterium]
MRTIVIPTDFSETANNAAHFAAQMLQGEHDVNVILYHVYERASHAAAANESLAKLKEDITGKAILRVECVAVEGDDIIDEIERVVRHRQANLVIMGITGKHALAKMFMGSNTLKLVDSDLVPVLIIPTHAKFTGIKNVALTSDFKKVKVSTPITPIKSILSMFRPAFHIINVDSLHYVSLTEEYRSQREDLYEMFEEFQPEFYFIGLNDFHEAIDQFVKDKHIDMLITVPRKHSFLSSLYTRSHTKTLVYQSTVPILATPE